MIAQNISKIREEIAEICAKTGRNKEEILLIAVSKNFGLAEVYEARKSGIIDFGENRAQDLRDKADEAEGEIKWHFIGHLQKNKVKYAVRAAEYIHSVESFSLAEEIDKRSAKEEKRQKIMLEVKTSFEDTKFGLETEKELIKLAEKCDALENIELCGLMTMAPYTDDEKIVRDCFVTLRKLKEKLNKEGHNLTELSMGMTADYRIAIEEGSTMLRIGTAIFGERNY